MNISSQGFLSLFGASAVAAAVGIVQATGVYGVRDFGAKGDGAAKDTAAIQRAIDAAHAADLRLETLAPDLVRVREVGSEKLCINDWRSHQ